MIKISLYFISSSTICLFGILLFTACSEKKSNSPDLHLTDISQITSSRMDSSATLFESNVAATSIHDMDESVLCFSTSNKSTTYFIQPDKADLKDVDLKYKDATIADMQTGLLIHDKESHKTTLFYLPGKFSLDSLKLKPDAIFPVLGITTYHSEIEKISSRWTDIVCKCISENALYDFEKEKKSCNEGVSATACNLSNQGAVLQCHTNCREGAVACCWFEF